MWVTELTFNDKDIAGSLLHISLLVKDLRSTGCQTIENNYFLEHLMVIERFCKI